MVSHYAAERITDPATEIDIRAGTGLSTEDKRALIDYRVGASATWTSTAAFSGPSFDMGSDLPTNANRCVIPAGHTLGGATWNVVSDGDVLFASAVTNVTLAVTGTGVIDFDFSVDNDERYWALINAAGTPTGPWSLEECAIGTYVQLSSDAAVGTSFRNDFAQQVIETEYPGGVAVTELAAPRRRFSLLVRNIAPGSADDGVLADVLENGLARPFWYWPPDTDDGGPYLVRLDRPGERSHDYRAPSVSLLYRYFLEMTEQAL